tara:strand:+ start:169 stop:1248 length:1080 start_codon:yes stop_codon:yes gene_type:complete
MKVVIRRTIEVLVGLAVIVVAVLWLSGGFGARISPAPVETASPMAPDDAAVAPVQRTTTDVTEWASGAVASAIQTEVSSQIMARIEEVRVSAGDAVQAGQTLVVLDRQEPLARADQARQALAGAQALFDLAETELKRIEQLFDRKVVTRQNLDQAIASFTGATADVDRLERALDAAEAALAYTEIRAPVEGVVVDRLAEPGEMASPGLPLLRIYDPAALRVEVPVRETLAVRLATGQRLGIEVPARGVTFDGTIEEIVPFAEPGARTLLVKVALPGDPGLYAGLFARVAIPAGQREQLLVPLTAINQVGQLDFVTTVGPERKLRRRFVTLGELMADDRIEVLSGLTVGETVLLPPVSTE